MNASSRARLPAIRCFLIRIPGIHAGMYFTAQALGAKKTTGKVETYE